MNGWGNVRVDLDHAGALEKHTRPLNLPPSVLLDVLLELVIRRGFGESRPTSRCQVCLFAVPYVHPTPHRTMARQPFSSAFERKERRMTVGWRYCFHVTSQRSSLRPSAPCLCLSCLSPVLCSHLAMTNLASLRLEMPLSLSHLVSQTCSRCRMEESLLEVTYYLWASELCLVQPSPLFRLEASRSGK